MQTVMIFNFEIILKRGNSIVFLSMLQYCEKYHDFTLGSIFEMPGTVVRKEQLGPERQTS